VNDIVLKKIQLALRKTHDMRPNSRTWLTAFAALLTSLSVGTRSNAERPERNEKTTNPNQVANSANVPADVVEELSAQDSEVLSLVESFAREAEQTIEQWLTSGAITEDRLFSKLYYPIANTSPVKYNTDYDALADRDFPAVQEKYLSKSSAFLFAIVTDSNGYAPTHNRQFAQPLSGNKALDFVGNRSKRFFGDLIGMSGARSTKRYLRQAYQRDTGELAENLSVPVTIRGKHWGCVRIGYRRIEK
jgi:methyl-accepting chemotaxis protein